MMKKHILPLLALCACLISTTGAKAHGLNMTSANITLRQHNHLSLTVATSLTELFRQLTWQGKPSSMFQLMSDEAQLTAFHFQLEQLFTAQLTVVIDGQLLSSRQTRVPSIKQLQQLLQEEIAKALLPPHTGKEDHDDYRTLVISIDGFMPKSVAAEQLNVHFPPALGPVLANYSEPYTQTLAPTANGSRFGIALKR